MRVPRPAAALLLGLLLPAVPGTAAQASAAAQPAAEPGAPAGSPAPRPLAAALAVVRGVDLERHQVVLAVDGADRPFGVDRNTLVYLPSGLATVHALHPGDEVRAAWNAHDVLYWVQVRGPAAAAAPAARSTPGQGTGPGGGTPAPPERAGTGAAPLPSTGTPR